jgi:PAS domain S-box-containing protein
MANAGSLLKRTWTNSSLFGKGLVVIAIPLSMLLLTVGSAYLTKIQGQKATNLVYHTLEVDSRIQRLHILLIEAEVMAHDYLLTGGQEYLDAYRQVVKERMSVITGLEKLMRDNPTQNQFLLNIEKLTSEADEQVASLIAENPAVTHPDSLKVALSKNKGAFDGIRQNLAALHVEEKRLLDARTTSLNQTSTFADGVMFAGTACGLLGGFVALLLFSNGVVLRMRSLEENARRLADERPLTPSPPASDEIGRLEQGLQGTSFLLAARQHALRLETERLSEEVAERNRAEVLLSESKRQLEAAVHSHQRVMDHSLDVICTMDREGRFVAVSAACEKVWGYKPAELIGRKYIELVCPGDHEKTTKVAADIMAGHATRYFENRYICKDGTLVPLTWSAYWSDKDNIMFCVARDNTETRRAAEALNEAWLAADRANHAKSEFLSRMSHELRTPLNAILGFSQILEMEHAENGDSESIEQILKAGRHLLELINEVLDISRIEAGRLSVSPEPVLLKEVVQDCVQLLRPLGEKRRIRIEGKFTTDRDHCVTADRQRLKQVLLNLLSNAVKYNRDAGSVTLSCEEEPGERLRIKVTDTGPGIAPENMERLFSPFERLNADDTCIEGTGLGLALSKRLVELMGGVIGVESKLGEGSTFWVKLPKAEAPGHAVEGELEKNGEEPHEMEPVPQEHTVLYIEDNVSNLRLVERILEQRPGVRLIAAMQGNMGLDMARQHLPDLILLDLNLPDMPGREVLHRLQAEPDMRRVPVIVISADATVGELDRMRAAGAHDYLSKPIDIRKFLNVVDHVLNDNKIQSHV